MNDLISRKAALSLAKELCVPTADGTAYKHRCIDPDEIRELPAAEPEVDCRKCIFCGFSGFKQFQTAQPEIIRCKDCTYFDATDCPSTLFPEWGRCKYHRINMRGEDFCSRAERKEVQE